MSANIPHDSADGHVSGESEFVDDRPFVNQELQVGIVYSKIAYGKINKIDTSRAEKLDGVVGIYSHKDLSFNRWGTIFKDQPVLAENECNYVGEPILLVAAEDREVLEKAKRLIQIDYVEETPTLTIDDAKKKELFIGPKRTIETGNVEKAIANAPHTLEGVVTLAGQEHFYLESQASIAYPKELGQIEVHSSSQHPTEVQHVVAHALGLKYHEVTCVVKRMGGAFGGKESQAAPFAIFAALVAAKTKRAARVVISKDDDMIMTGKRNPFQNDYKVGFDNDGKILGLKVDLFSDGGAYADLSTAIMERAMLHCDNAYFIPSAKITGQVCKTNFPPNTAFRGFGGPKGVVTIENIIEEIAHHLKLDALQVREKNVYRLEENHKTPYGQKIDQNMLPRLFKNLSTDCEYGARRKAIDEHNAKNLDTVRGLSLTAVKFGISFTTKFLNQGSALVNVHMDGSVQVSTGATEMGQGVNTKIAQVVAGEFGISPNDVRIMPTSTEKNHNTSPTAASSGSDINGAAAKIACEKIKARLAELAVILFRTPTDKWASKTAAAGTAEEITLLGNTDTSDVIFSDGSVSLKSNSKNRIKFSELVVEAYLNRVSLGGYGYYRYPGIFFNKETGKGNPFFYFTNGVAASEVSVDRFTGETKVLRTDILMDLGRPINPGIDRGQVTGAFVQGMGWVTTEKLHYDEKGNLHSFSPSTYKIPSIQDIPRTFNINLLDNDENQKNVRGSKAVGEPPLLLGVSVWTAIKNALTYIHPEKKVHLDLPATQEEVLMSIYE